MAERDYYEILGVARDATPDAIKKAYRGLARSSTPTSIRATSRRKAASRKSSRLTTCLRTRRSGRFTTGMAGRRSRGWPRPGRGRILRSGAARRAWRCSLRSSDKTTVSIRKPTVVKARRVAGKVHNRSHCPLTSGASLTASSLSRRLAGGRGRWLDGDGHVVGLDRRTPGPPPFSSMNPNNSRSRPLKRLVILASFCQNTRIAIASCNFEFIQSY